MPNRLPDPDLARHFRQQIAESIQFFGSDITLRKFIGVSAGSPEFGIGDTWIYQQRPARAEMRELKPSEIQMVGGQDYQGGYYFTMADRPFPRDEIQFPAQSGLVYRIATEPVPENIGTTLYWSFIGLRGQGTGNF